MELNVLSRWESLGKQLYQRGELGREIERLVSISKAAAKHRRSPSPQLLPPIGPSKNLNSTKPIQIHQTQTDGGTKPTTSTVSSGQSSHFQVSPEQLSALHDLSVLPLPQHSSQSSSAPSPSSSSSSFSSTSSSSSSSSSAEREQIQDELERDTLSLLPSTHQQVMLLSYRAFRRFLKGFTIGYCGKFLFGLISALLKYRTRNIRTIIKQILKLFIEREIYSYGMLLGAFLCVFESFMRVLRQLRIASNTAQQNAIEKSTAAAASLSTWNYSRLSSTTTNLLSSPATTASAAASAAAAAAIESLPKINRLTRCLLSASVASCALYFIPSSSRTSISMFFPCSSIRSNWPFTS